jgi:BirA family biotin operon repressor/biotin-[acetyl-CoA-carboxylase] ligase
LVDCRFGKPLYYLKSVTSTSDFLKERAEKGAPEGCVVVAETQTAGRGRRGRHWLSLPGKGVYLSLLLRPQWPASESPFISIFASLAAARALENLRIGKVNLKWPNDLLVQGKKIGGVLVEPRVNSGQLEFVVVGVGINVLHRHDDLQSLGIGKTTSCYLEGLKVECEDVIARVLAEFDLCYYMIQRGDKATIIKEWSRRSIRNGSKKLPDRIQKET